MPIALNQINATDAKTIASILQKSDSSLIYFWSPYCSSESCINPLAVKTYCDSNNLNFIFIIEYFDSAYLQSLPLDYLVYGINNSLYNTDYCPKYLKRFRKDLTGKKNWTTRFIKEENGKYTSFNYQLILQ